MDFPQGFTVGKPITTLEFCAISVFVIIVLVTNSVPLATPSTLLFVLGITFFQNHEKDEKLQKYVHRFRNFIIFFFPLLFFLDYSSTIYAVHILKIAYETNPFVVWLWESLGTYIGTFLWIAIQLSFFFILFKATGTKIKLPFVRLIFTIILLSWFILVFIAVFNNISILAHHFRC